MLKLLGVILGAPRKPFYIGASSGDPINTFQEKLQTTLGPRRLGSLKPYEIILWKVVVCSNVLFKLLITFA